MRKKYGAYEQSHLYTIASDTLAASTVSRYLADRGMPAVVLDTPSAGVALLSSQDAVVFLGPGTGAQLPDAMNRLGYVFKRIEAGANSGFVDRHDAKVEYPVISQSPSRSTSHGLIALLPGKSPGATLLVVASSFNPALASVLTLGPELEILSRFVARKNTGKYFEVMIRYERNGDKVLDARPVAARKSEF